MSVEGVREPGQKRLPVIPQAASPFVSLLHTLIHTHTLILPEQKQPYTPTLRYNSDTILREAARIGDLEEVKKHLGKLGFCSLNGRTALMEAAAAGHLEVVKACLLEAGAVSGAGPGPGYNAATDGVLSYSSETVDESTEYRDVYIENRVPRFTSPLNLPIDGHSQLSDPYGYIDSSSHHTVISVSNSTSQEDSPRATELNGSGLLSANEPHDTLTNEVHSIYSDSSSDSSSSDSNVIWSQSPGDHRYQQHSAGIQVTNRNGSNSQDGEARTYLEETEGFYSSELTGSFSEYSSGEFISSNENSISFHTASFDDISRSSFRALDRIEEIFKIGILDEQSSFMSLWNSNYSTVLKRDLDEHELQRTLQSYSQAGDFIPGKNTALTLAIRNCHKDVVTLLMKSEVGFAGVTPLMAAAASNDLPKVLLNMEYINARDTNGFTALSIATLFGHLKCAEILLNEFVEVLKYSRIADPLIIAAKHGYLGHLSMFLQETSHRQSLHLVSAERSHVALVQAVKYGHLDCLVALTQFRVRNNDISKVAFLYAAKTGRIDCMNHLISVCPGRLRKYGDLFLIAAIKTRKTEMIEFICKQITLSIRPRPSPLLFAVLSRDRHIISLVQGCCKHQRVGGDITPLMISAALGDAEALTRHMPLANRRDAHGLTALMYASIAGPEDNIAVYDDLISAEARMVNFFGLPAIAYAIKSNNLPMISRLLPYEAMLAFSQFYTILDIAACHGSTEALHLITTYIYQRKLQIFIKPRQMLMHQQHLYSNPLIESVESADVEGVKKYIYQASCCMDSWSALQKAVQLRNQECVKMLLCEMGYKNSLGYTALICAVIDNNLEAAELLLAEVNCSLFEGKTCLMMAASLGYAELVELLIPYEAGKTAESGETALIMAVMDDQVECAKLLLPYEKKLTDNNGNSALMHSIYRSSMECVKLLLEDERRMVSSQKYTALALAMQENFVDAAKLLYEHEKDLSGITELMWAAFINDMTGVLTHLDQVKIQSTTRSTALMYAASSNNVDIVKVLIPHEKRLVDDTGHTALLYAIEAKAPDTTKMLLPYESDMRTFKAEGITEIAKGTGSPEIVSIIQKFSAGKYVASED